MPLVIAANKNDLPHRMNEVEIRTALDLKKNTPVFFISAKRNEDVRFVLESLVEFITQFSY